MTGGLVTLTLPKPPSKNAQYVERALPASRGRKARVIRSPSKEYTDWKERAGAVVRRADPTTVEVECFVSIIADKPDRRRRDVHNYVDPVLDLLEKTMVVKDDSLCALRHVDWHRDEHGAVIINPAGEVEVTVEVRDPIRGPLL